MKCSSRTYQNFPQFWNTKTQVDFFPIPIISALVYVDKGKVNEVFTWVFIFQRYGKFQVFQWENLHSTYQEWHDVL